VTVYLDALYLMHDLFNGIDSREVHPIHSEGSERAIREVKRKTKVKKTKKTISDSNLNIVKVNDSL
jgi:hypothetical protein